MPRHATVRPISAFSVNRHASQAFDAILLH